MENYTNKSKLPQSFAAGQPNNTQVLPNQSRHSFTRSSSSKVSKPSHEDIAKRAYQIYVDMGSPQGQSEQIWDQAEKELLSRH